MAALGEARVIDLAAIDTPAVLIDLDVFERNLDRMGELARAAGVNLRPHTKTHKSSMLAKQQLERGARGITVATLGEAEVMAAAGFRDILLAYPPIGDAKLQRLGALASQIELSVSLDDVRVAEGVARVGRDIGRPIRVYVEVDCGLGRCGRTPGADAADTAAAVARLTGVNLAGLLTHAGQAYHATDEAALRQVALDEGAALSVSADALRARGLVPGVLSVGSTPTARYIAEVARAYPVSEMRPGTYVFNDVNQVTLGSATETDCALTILATVVSFPRPGRVIIDAGSKTLGADAGVAAGYGRVKGNFSQAIAFLNEAHGVLHVPPSCDWRIGSKVEIIPNHACIPPSLADEMLAVRGGIVESTIRVDGRGRNR